MVTTTKSYHNEPVSNTAKNVLCSLGVLNDCDIYTHTFAYTIGLIGPQIYGGRLVAWLSYVCEYSAHFINVRSIFWQSVFYRWILHSTNTQTSRWCADRTEESWRPSKQNIDDCSTKHSRQPFATEAWSITIPAEVLRTVANQSQNNLYKTHNKVVMFTDALSVVDALQKPPEEVVKWAPHLSGTAEYQGRMDTPVTQNTQTGYGTHDAHWLRRTVHQTAMTPSRCGYIYR